MGLFSFLENIWPIRLFAEKNASELVLDKTLSKMMKVRWFLFGTGDV